MERKKYEKLPVSILEQYPMPDREAVYRNLAEAYIEFQRKIIVLDDDPTGVQTVHDVPVYTDWEYKTLREGIQEPGNMFFVLTNSRSFSADETLRQHRLIAERIRRAAGDSGREVLLVLRGDSTLRGHYLLEPEAVREELERERGVAIHGQILCPFFREGGRYTIHGVHYVKEGEQLVPAGETEFARDKTFGYEASYLGDYVEEKSGGHFGREDCIHITLELLRSESYEEITRLLCRARNFQPVLVDAIAECDVEIFTVCLLRAMKAGKEFLIRSAAAVPKVLGRVDSRPLLTREEILAEPDGKGRDSDGKKYGGIVLIGSHVKKTTQQIEALMETECPTEYLEFDVNACLRPGGLEEETAGMIEKAECAMEKGRTAVVYTSRTLLAPEGIGKEELLQLSVQISDALTGVVAGLHRKPRFLIAKGGITSSDVGVKALKVRKAVVLGQIAPGIPVWRIGAESRFPGLSYIIFPGNVGERDTLKKIVEMLN